MREEVARLCAKWASEGKPGIDIGIGIHTGYAVIGNIGSEKRIEYTAIGDAVNVAARIEQLTKELKTPILISETTVAAIREQFNFKALGPQAIRGRTETIDVYTIN
jgi:adenylate cyclase